LFALLCIPHIPFSFLHSGCISVTGAGSYRSLPLSLQLRHWSNTLAIALDLSFLLELHCSVILTLLYSHCLLCPLPYIDEATTPLSIRICILIYPWLALGEQSEGGLISMVGYLSIFACSLLGTKSLWRACMLFTSTRAGPAWLGWAREGLLGPSRAFTRTFYFQEGYAWDRRAWNIPAT
jgi:hypothetical protein